ncbi:hypothetical protein CTRI78_v007294 [Colletotrichum trifolii]|uniref:BZIP domain-containing protein n=1 Tax=Colletotrichum trifolii TaxID=5466 RepID=A0A4R8R6N2_COLTR|nr:hypothetical protein CTRI78_v007294 [Colletotrichum trifolii]
MADATYNRPRTRQRISKAAPALQVPNIDENAAERKRVLNVLAQRRYRERKKQTRLAKQKQGDESESVQAGTSGDSLSAEAHVEEAEELLSLNEAAEDATAAAFDSDAGDLWTVDLSDGTGASDFMFGLEMPPFTQTPGGSVTSSSSINPASLLSTSSSSSPSEPADFPDSYLLPMSDLKVLKGLLRIATRLDSYTIMWDPAANSLFNAGGGTPASLLPETWRPTATQVLTPHHPIMDFLPWPGVRDRIISVFSLPDAARPPAARGPLGLVNFAYDLEDSCEGARIWGADPYDATSWEVGQVLFARWWFVFDRGVIEQSNRWRRLRGAAALQLEPGSMCPVPEDMTDNNYGATSDCWLLDRTEEHIRTESHAG